ncbi:hypothetical protein HPP92_025640 [Vanilla planifolia]|uniref:Uncharacterized protein n=1 Tax=Vanilla planifolia TaxID=51239 RepID=A0A835PFR6_VANPL|nr:hypothetical protein HPP92_025640 [Vanilla planifolia]
MTASTVIKGSHLLHKDNGHQFSDRKTFSDVDVLRQAINDSLEDNNMGFDNLSASSSASVGTTIKLQTHKSLETTDAGESAHVSMRKMMNNEEVSRSEEVNHWEQQSNASSSKGLDLWGNLKSMALGIIHLWKR